MLESFSFKETLTCFMVLFAVIDILGSVPIIVSLRKQFGHIDAERASIVSGVLMIVFLFVGKEMLKFIGIDVNSFGYFYYCFGNDFGNRNSQSRKREGSFYRSDCVSFSSRSWNVDDYLITSCRISCSKYYFRDFAQYHFGLHRSKICQFLRRKNRRCYADDFQKSFWNYPFSDFY